MNVLILTVVVLVVCVWLLSWWLVQPKYHYHVTVDDFERFFDSFIDRMGDGSVLLFEHEGSERFVQFALYENDRGAPALSFGLPDAAWTREHFMPVKNGLEAAQFRVVTDRTDVEEVPRFIRVDAEGIPAELIRTGAAIARVALRAMGCTDKDTFRVHCEGNWVGPRANRK